MPLHASLQSLETVCYTIIASGRHRIIDECMGWELGGESYDKQSYYTSLSVYTIMNLSIFGQITVI